MQKIFIGLLFLFFHFRIEGFDLLPQFVGYILIGMGFADLSKTDAAFGKNGNLFYGFAVFEFCAILASFLLPGFIIVFVQVIIQICALYMICQAVENSEQEQGELGAAHLRDCWLFYTTICVFSLICNTFQILLIFDIILSIFAFIAYLIGFYHTQSLYEQRANRTDTEIV